ncbi:MAG: class I SAM-dependent methyltransferase [Acidimicrobiia bacterium]
MILARSPTGAEVAARFSVGETTSIVDADLSDASRELLHATEADLIVVAYPADDRWMSAALGLTRELLGPGSEIRMVIDPAVVSTATEDLVADVFSGWMVSGVTVDAGVLALHVRPSSEDAEPEATRESVQGALQIAAMLKTVLDPVAENLPEFEVRASHVMSYLRQVPRLQAETEVLRRQLRDLESSGHRKGDQAKPTPTVAEAVPPEDSPQNRGVRGRRSRRARKLILAATAAVLIAGGAWVLASWLDLDINGYLTLLALGAIALTLYDVRRRFVMVNARAARLARQVERASRRTESQVTSLKGAVATESRRARARAEETKARAIDLSALTRETAAAVRTIESSQLRARENMADLSRTIQTHAGAMDAHSKRMSESLEKGNLAKMVRAELLTAYNQIESNFRLRDLVDVTGPTPQLRGWAASPDVIAFLVREMQHSEPRIVLECGSGASTVWLAMAARTKGLKTRVVALEHDELYASETTRLLEECGVDDIGEVRLAPIEEIELNGHRGPWYSRAALNGLAEIGLVFVDGPPGAFGLRSRYPALPVLRPLLADGATVVLDDLIRDEERQTMSLWADEFPEMEVSELKVEKGAAVFRLHDVRDV